MKPPDPQRWKRIEEVFQAAVELPRSRREAFLAEACGSDAVLRLEVDNLVDADAEADEFLETPAVGPPPQDGSESDTDTAKTLLLATELAPAPAPLPSDFSLTPGEVLSGRFRVVRFLAAGGMGEVYEAEDLELGGRLALKTILRQLADDPTVMERFRREVHLARQVTHPSICRSYDIFHHALDRSDFEATQKVTFLTMELLRGETLRQRIRRQGPMTAAEALPILRQVAEGLAAAHQAAVVHRDLKSSNVFLVNAERGVRAVVTDFGLARLQTATPIGPGTGGGDPTDAAATDIGTLMGTPAYMAPEQLLGEEITPATDVYALGIVMYEMATGQLPFAEDEDPFQRLVRPAPAPEKLVAQLDPKWAGVIRRSLRRRPVRRFATGLELVLALEDRRATRPSRQPWVAALLVLFLAAGAWSLYETLRPPEEPGVVSLRPQGEEAARLFDEGLRRLRRLEAPAARQLLGDAAALEPDLPLVHRALGEAWLEDGYEAAARSEATRAYELRVGLPRPELLRVGAFYHETMPRGQASLEPAVELYRTLYDEDPDLETGLCLASVLRRTGEVEQAFAVLDEIRPPLPGDPRIELEEIRIAGALGDPERLRSAAGRGLAGSSELPWLTVRIHLALAEAWRLVGDLEEASAAARIGGVLAEELGDEVSLAHSRLQLAMAAGRSGREQEAKEIYEEVRQSYLRIDHPTALMRLYSRLGLVAFGDGSLQEAADHFSQAIDAAREIDHWLLAWYLYNLGSTMEELDRLEAARARYEEAQTRAEAFDDRQLLVDIHHNLAGVLRGLGRLDEALVTYEESLRLAREEGDLPRVARQLANLGALHHMRGELAAAEQRYEEASALEVDDTTVRAVVISGLGYVALARGKLQEARGRFTAALALRRELGEMHNVPESRLALAEVAFASDRIVEAESLARQAAEELAELKSPDKELKALVVLGQALLRRGRLEAARAALTRAGGLAAASNYPELRLQLGIVEVRLRSAVGEADVARLEEVLAQAQASGFGELVLQARLALGGMALAAGEAVEGRTRLEALAADADKRGFSLIAARARKVLDAGQTP